MHRGFNLVNAKESLTVELFVNQGFQLNHSLCARALASLGENIILRTAGILDLMAEQSRHLLNPDIRDIEVCLLCELQKILAEILTVRYMLFRII